jgi:uncharacterized membrane protein (DUF373 family)
MPVARDVPCAPESNHERAGTPPRGRSGSMDGTTIKARLSAQVKAIAASFRGLSIYERFEHAVIIVLTVLIVAVVTSATWHLAIVVAMLLFTDAIQPENQTVFQTVFGMIFTVIIALEFKHSLLMVLTRQESVVRVRSVVLIAMLAMVRKFIVLDIGEAAAAEVFALSAAILALGIVYWLVRDEQRQLADREGNRMLHGGS